MPLNLDNPSPIYRLGRSWALARSYVPEDFSDTALDTALARPSAGLALLQKEIAAKVRKEAADDLAEGIGQILDGVAEMPLGPIPVEAQGEFWLGYYHQRRGLRTWLHAEELRQAGTALYGEQWQSDLARGLGVAPRRVREWLEREAPPRWVRAAVYALLMTKSRETATLADALIAKRPSDEEAGEVDAAAADYSPSAPT